MKKLKFALCILLVIAILFSSVFFFGCSENSSDIDTSLSGVTYEGNASGITGKPWLDDQTASFAVKPTDVIDEKDFTAPLDGTLLSYVDFDEIGESAKLSTAVVFKKYGFIEGKLKEGALAPLKAALSLNNYNSTGDYKLYVRGYDKSSNTSYGDGYLNLISKGAFGIYSESDYSFSYDVIYNGTSTPTSCFAICTDYAGESYNYFAITNAGAFRFQKCENGTFKDLVKTNTSLIEDLIGVKYDKTKDSLTGISMSVRGVISKTDGASYYVRVNSEGYPGTGKWVLVCSSKVEHYGHGITLMFTNGQNGFFDNFKVWAGTKEEPDFGEALIKADTTCSAHSFENDGSDCIHNKTCKYCGYVSVAGNHNFEEVTGVNDGICTICGSYYSTLVQNTWQFYDIPKYRDGGDFAIDIVYVGGILAENISLSKESQMQIVTGTTSEMLKKYATRLEAYGFTQSFANSIEKNLYYQYIKDGKSIYCYYSSNDDSIRIIYDKYGVVSPSDMNYKAKSGKVSDTVYYQYGVEMAKTTTDSLKDNGMLHIIKLCDNSLVIIDGLSSAQIYGDRIIELMNFLREITGTKDGEKIQITAWLNTHLHGDHYKGILAAIKQYSDCFTVERIITNPISLTYTSFSTKDVTNAYSLWTCLDLNDTKFIKIHNGAKFNLGGVEFEYIHTQEDMIDSEYLGFKSTDFNSSSSAWMVTINGAKFYVCGDITESSQGVILGNYTEDTLKCHVLQTAHHLFNGVTEMYALNKADFVLVTQGENYAKTQYDHVARYLEAATAYAKEKNIYFQDAGTFGFKVPVKGKVKLVYTREIPTYD